MSVFYDGDGNGCLGDDVYIMVVSVGVFVNINFWKFLICLINYFIIYIVSLIL